MPSDLTLDIGAGGTAVSVLTTELNALANNAASTLSAAVDNAVNLDRYVWFELNATFAATPTADSVVEIYVVYLNSDGTNWGDYNPTGVVVDPNTYIGSIVLRASTAAQRRISPVAFLRARSFKVGVVNKSGVAMTASGHVLRAYYERDAAT